MAKCLTKLRVFEGDTRSLDFSSFGCWGQPGPYKNGAENEGESELMVELAKLTAARKLSLHIRYQLLCIARLIGTPHG